MSEFGANQVIIVRNDEAKRSLPTQLANALVMTPLEAKGLESTAASDSTTRAGLSIHS